MPQDTQSDPRPLFFRLWRGYLRQHLGWLGISAVLLMLEGSTAGALSYMFKPMFDRVFIAGQSGAIWFVAFAILGLFMLRAVTGVGQRVILTRISQLASARMQVDLFRHVLRLDPAFFLQTAPGVLIERVQGDVVTIQNIWTALIAGTGRDLVALISLMAVAISVDPVWTLVAIVGTPLMVLPSLAVQRYIRRKSVVLRNIAGRRTTRLDEVFHGVIAVKLNGLEAYQEQKFSDLSDDVVRATIKANAAAAAAPALVDIAIGIGFFAVMLYGGQEIMTGQKTVGQFMSFFSAMALAFQPLRRLGAAAGLYQTMMASLARIYALFDMQPTIREITASGERGKAPARLASTTVHFEDVSLSYGEMPVLKGLSLTAEAGKTTAIVGLSGAGKSTVFNALTRLVDPQSGRVSIGGRDIREMPLAELRARFSVVTQDALLFDETVRENILLGRTDVSEAELARVLEAAHAAEFIAAMSDGLETPVGPRGADLSGGQRQRVAIARALLRNAEILLLDEATSALDARSEAAVQAALDTLSAGRTTLVIAHRLSTIRDADKIVVLDGGRVVEQGRHDALLAAGGLYRRLYDLQFRP